MKATERIDQTALDHIRRIIEDAEGQEVLLVGHCDPAGLVTDVEPVARGSFTAVPVPMDLCDYGDLVLHNHPSGVLHPSEADVRVAADLAGNGIGSAILDNECRNIYVIVEPHLPRRRLLLDREEMTGVLDTGGGMAGVHASFRRRESQIGMVDLVTRAFNNGSVLAAEAGTGVGKSFAYLVPALSWARANDERVVIATATINLQEQLVGNDIPSVQKALGTNLPVALVKGRGNFLCPRRLREQTDEPELFAEHHQWIEGLNSWAAETVTGSRSDVPFFIPDEVWQTVNSEPDGCSPARCEQRDRCFVLRARQEAARAKILVANHHIVFSDLAVRHAGFGWDQTAILPPFRHIILDEAHNLERNATSFFSDSVSSAGLRRQLARLDMHRGRKRFGLLEKLKSIGAAGDGITEAGNRIVVLRDRIDVLNAGALLFLGDGSTFRLTAETMENFHAVLGAHLIDVQNAIRSLIDACASIRRSIGEEYHEHQLYYELQTMIRRFEAPDAVFHHFQEPDFDEQVFWLEKRSGNRAGAHVRFVVTPVDVSSRMRETLFERHDTVICTSATLAIHESFAFWAAQTGFPLENSSTGVFPSPFPYASRVLFAVPEDAVDPSAAEYPDYLRELLLSLLDRRGSALVLFTSYRLLNEIHDAIAPVLGERGLTVYRQGSDDRSRLLERFRNDVSSVLFATDSFWEGVDVPGDALRLVVLARLPFRVPTEPVQQARAEALTRAGGNPFSDMALPQAVMKLKQGFGRLMRKDDDYGVVVVSDSRIARKWYGKAFVASLPETRRELLPTNELVSEVHSFLTRFERE